MVLRSINGKSEIKNQNSILSIPGNIFKMRSWAPTNAFYVRPRMFAMFAKLCFSGFANFWWILRILNAIKFHAILNANLCLFLSVLLWLLLDLIHKNLIQIFYRVFQTNPRIETRPRILSQSIDRHRRWIFCQIFQFHKTFFWESILKRTNFKCSGID